MNALFISLFVSLLFSQNPNNAKSTGIAVGEKAPAISTKDVSGAEINWDELLKKGPVVVVFYRGGWCPFCNVYLASLVKELETIQQYGTLIAVTPQKPEKIEETLANKKITFPLIYDEGGKIATAYKSVSEKHNVPGFAQAEYAGSVLPVPATYIINQGGIVTKRHFDENYKVRMDVNELVAELKRITKK